MYATCIKKQRHLTNIWLWLELGRWRVVRGFLKWQRVGNMSKKGNKWIWNHSKDLSS